MTRQTSIRAGSILAGLVLGTLFLWLALRRADPQEALAALVGASGGWCATVAAAGLGFMALKTLRWQWLLKPVGVPDFQVLQRAVYIGSAVNMIVPHVGELLRSTLLSRSSTIPVGTALGSVAVERVLDMAALLLIVLPFVLFGASTPATLWPATGVAVVIVLVGLTGVLDLRRANGVVRRLWRKLRGRLPGQHADRLALQLRHLNDGLMTLSSGRRILVALLLSLCQWALVVLAVWASARAVGLGISPAVSVVVFVLAVVGLTLPSAPATLGTTQLAFVAGLALVEAPVTLAVAASFVYTTCFIIATMLIGAVWWLRTRGA